MGMFLKININKCFYVTLDLTLGFKRVLTN